MIVFHQCRDSSLSAESFAAGVAGGSSLSEREELDSRACAELERLKQVGVTGKVSPGGISSMCSQLNVSLSI